MPKKNRPPSSENASVPASSFHVRIFVPKDAVKEPGILMRVSLCREQAILATAKALRGIENHFGFSLIISDES